MWVLQPKGTVPIYQTHMFRNGLAGNDSLGGAANLEASLLQNILQIQILDRVSEASNAHNGGRALPPSLRSGCRCNTLILTACTNDQDSDLPDTGLMSCGTRC